MACQASHARDRAPWSDLFGARRRVDLRTDVSRCGFTAVDGLKEALLAEAAEA
ncbi:MAG: hypothetical protein AVDCRST_MAG75-271 [uncultured Propionibacteriaceae bacterium]|uniref:Uncharacterized protein n=1 Tax=uncultured Propionibacteriaceae bacterium TaxID=257457 RepID=A0A6J4N4W0_9ACTN|nr:MAG: hypothetical protein AVDCRST_MAG75-271 [uncultured Propionibacteriaceae bacterium]